MGGGGAGQMTLHCGGSWRRDSGEWSISDHSPYQMNRCAFRSPSNPVSLGSAGSQ